MIIPAILTDSVEEAQKKLDRLKGLVPWVQIDIVDGKFASNRTIMPKDIKRLKTNLKKEAHLMVLSPGKYLSELKKAGVKRILFHVEAAKDPEKTIKKIKALKMQAGICLNPETPADAATTYIDKADLVLFLGVRPGFGGQRLIPQTLKKVRQLKSLAPKLKIGVDGGVNASNARKIWEAGADILYVGSSIFNEKDVTRTIEKLK